MLLHPFPWLLAAGLFLRSPLAPTPMPEPMGLIGVAPVWADDGADIPAPSTAAVQAAMEVGITPEGLAASGFTAGNASAILANLDAATDQRASLAQAWAAATTQGQALVAARTAAAADPFNTTLQAQRTAAAEAFQSARALVQTRQEALFNLAVDGFDQDAIARLRLSHRRSVQGLPPSYRVVEWSASDLNSLYGAVVAARRAQSGGGGLPAQAQDRMSQASLNPVVSQAEQWCASRLADISAAFHPQP